MKEDNLPDFVPQPFADMMIEMYGDKGVTWLRQLPALIDACERRWSLTALPPFPDLSYNYVAPAVLADGTAVVLKLGVLNPELLTEIEALRFYDGRGMCRLLAADSEWGALVLERLKPGTMLVSLEDDEQATSIAAQVMRQLWRPAPPEPHPFPTIAKWAAGLGRLRPQFDGGTGPFPAQLVEQAEALFTELLASQAEPVLLHGDLHHYNILTAERHPWLAIDPKGVVGEPAYEIGAWLRNPFDLLDRPQPARILARRVDQLAEVLELDRARLAGWGMAQAVLSGWWNFEERGHAWERVMVIARHLADLL